MKSHLECKKSFLQDFPNSQRKTSIDVKYYLFAYIKHLIWYNFWIPLDNKFKLTIQIFSQIDRGFLNGFSAA